MEQADLDKKMHLYRVEVWHDDPKEIGKSVKTDEFHVAQNISDVWRVIAPYLEDESREVKMIRAEVPVLSVIKPTQP